MRKLASKRLLLAAIAAMLLGGIPYAYAARVGQKLPNVKIRDANDKPSYIPDFGKKVLTVIYADMQSADMNDSVADAIKATKPDLAKYRGIGVANLKDTWAPDAVVRMVVRRKSKKYKSTILTDPDYLMPKKWGFGDCDDVSVVLVIGKDKKVKYIKKGPVRGAEIKKVLDIIAAELAKDEKKEPKAGE